LTILTITFSLIFKNYYMMKKLLMVCALFLLGTAMMNAQFDNIGILGGSTSVGWGSDLDMTTTDGVTYTYSGLVITVPDSDAGVKFRKDDAWDVNWGSNTFPAGTATQNGANIPATNGTWDVSFNKDTGAYTFVESGATFDEVALVGGGMTLNFFTADGENYSLLATAFAEGTYHFTSNGTGQWGGAGFPAGTATDGNTITVPAGYYSVTFNATSGAYAFVVPVVSLVGSAVDPDWAIDVDLVSTDGITYTKQAVVLAAGEAKFRQDHAWAVNWGAVDFPSGTGTQEGANIIVTTPGTYDVTFNRSGAYTFQETAGVKEATLASVKAYPNPAQTVWTIDAGSATISSIQVTDLAGKVVLSLNANSTSVTVDAAAFANGVYFARVNAGEATTAVKLVKN
jgi:starch-binding outer membrane protein SusE/F